MTPDIKRGDNESFFSTWIACLLAAAGCLHFFPFFVLCERGGSRRRIEGGWFAFRAPRFVGRVLDPLCVSCACWARACACAHGGGWASGCLVAALVVAPQGQQDLSSLSLCARIVFARYTVSPCPSCASGNGCTSWCGGARTSGSSWFVVVQPPIERGNAEWDHLQTSTPEQGQEFSDAAYNGDIPKLQSMLDAGFQINSPDTVRSAVCMPLVRMAPRAVGRVLACLVGCMRW